MRNDDVYFEERDRGHCIGCMKELSHIDDSPNGEYNATCAQCRAEEDHDYDLEPDAVFNCFGHRVKAAPKIIKSVLVFTHGDQSVGLNGERVTINAEGDFIIDLEAYETGDRPGVVEDFRQKLSAVFSEIWNDRAQVEFDFENNAN